MRLLIQIVSLLAVATLLTGYTDQWKDQIHQIGKTTVSIKAGGSDERLIIIVHRVEAESMIAFADTYNQIAYNDVRTQTQTCEELEKATIEAIQQRERSFANLYEVKCNADTTAQAPELQMIIYPQVRHDYHFNITFKPTH